MSERKLEMTLHPDLAKRLDEVVEFLDFGSREAFGEAGFENSWIGILFWEFQKG